MLDCKLQCLMSTNVVERAIKFRFYLPFPKTKYVLSNTTTAAFCRPVAI